MIVFGIDNLSSTLEDEKEIDFDSILQESCLEEISQESKQMEKQEDSIYYYENHDYKKDLQALENLSLSLQDKEQDSEESVRNKKLKSFDQNQLEMKLKKWKEYNYTSCALVYPCSEENKDNSIIESNLSADIKQDISCQHVTGNVIHPVRPDPNHICIISQ